MYRLKTLDGLDLDNQLIINQDIQAEAITQSTAHALRLTLRSSLREQSETQELPRLKKVCVDDVMGNKSVQVLRFTLGVCNLSIDRINASDLKVS